MTRDSSPFRARLAWILVACVIAGGGVWFFFLREPPLDMTAIAEHNNRGLGLLERFEYAEAASAFEKVGELAPRWVPGKINLGIALLNTNTPENLDRARRLFEDLLRDKSDDPHAHFCLAIILRQQGSIENAQEHFRAVLKRDPADASTWFWLGTTEDPSSEKAIEAYRKALENDPGLAAAAYALGLALRGQDEAKSKELLQRHKLLTESGVETPAKLAYGKMGKYAEAIGSREGRSIAAAPLPALIPSNPSDVALAPETRWATDADLWPNQELTQAIRKRFGGTMVVLDFDQDGRPDLFLAGAVVEKGSVRNLLLRNLGEGKFADVTSKIGLASAPPCLGCCVGDFDNDGFPDLLLTTTKGVRLFRNRGKDGDTIGFDDVTQAAGLSESTDVCLGAAWVDLDSDGDLDLVVARYAANEASALERLSGKKSEPLGLGVYLNVGKSAAGPVGAIQRLSAEFRRAEQPKELLTTDGPALHVAVGDFNGDRSSDLIVVQDGAAPKHLINDRLLHFRSQMLPEKLIPNAAWNGALVLDSDNRERSDLFFVGSDRPPVLVKSNGVGQETAFDAGVTNSPPLMQAIAMDVDLDGWVDILGVTPTGEAIFLHNKQGSLLATPSLFAPLGVQAKGIHAIASLDADGDFRPDIAVWSKTSGLTILRNAGNGNEGVSISLSGRREKKEKLRCNADAFGSRLTVHAGTLTSSMERSTSSAGLGQSSQPALIGLGKRKLADVLRLRWPDGTWQAELSVPANQTNRISQTDRTPDSCPLLFAWDGEKYGFVADFLGAGTLGEYLPDGTCRQPRPEESVKIESHQLQPRDGKLKLKLTEPMDEVTYLDKVLLVAVDHPTDMHVYPDERFSEALPSQDLQAFRRILRPIRATDHRGRNVLPELSRRDRMYLDGFARQSWLGYAEDHHVDLDFGEALKEIKSTERLFLCIYGWTDYAYPEAIWAATQASVPLTAPILEERVGGEWKKVDVEVGFPAGRPRMTLVELTGKRRGAGPFRLRTNMQVFWDEIFLAVGEASISAKELERPGSPKTDAFRATVLAPLQAELRAGGGCTEWSPDGKQPTIFSDGPATPVPVTRLKGRLTRWGDVKGLLGDLDDLFVTFGPGSEVLVDFDATKLPALPAGWTRSYVLRSWGYCKGSSLFTATGGNIEPLPFRSMLNFPYGPDQKHPRFEDVERNLKRPTP